MKSKAILLVHGMGPNTPPANNQPGSFGQAFITSTTSILNQFSHHETDAVANYADIYEYNYSQWFADMRKKMADNATAMNDRLAAISAIYGASFPLDFASRLSAYESKFNGNEFFYTHCLDVIFYGTMLGAAVRVKAGKQIAELVQNYGQGNVHIVAHSLGTAVMHDTLALLYRPESDPNGDIPDLDPVNHRLGSVWMFANVSRLVNSVTRLTDPLGSAVKPGNGGCTSAFYNIRHKLDPFTWLAKFDPQNNGAWVSEPIYNSRYECIENTLIVDANTHSFTQYLQDPNVIEYLFPFLLGDAFKTTDSELKAIEQGLVKKSLNGAYASLEDSLKEIQNSTDPNASWLDFINAAKAFIDAVGHIQAHF